LALPADGAGVNQVGLVNAWPPQQWLAQAAQPPAFDWPPVNHGLLKPKPGGVVDIQAGFMPLP
jgi:hypothetical protein